MHQDCSATPRRSSAARTSASWRASLTLRITTSTSVATKPRTVCRRVRAHCNATLSSPLPGFPFVGDDDDDDAVSRAMNRVRNLQARHKTRREPVNIAFQLTEEMAAYKDVETGTALASSPVWHTGSAIITETHNHTSLSLSLYVQAKWSRERCTAAA